LSALWSRQKSTRLYVASDPSRRDWQSPAVETLTNDAGCRGIGRLAIRRNADMMRIVVVAALSTAAGAAATYWSMRPASYGAATPGAPGIDAAADVTRVLSPLRRDALLSKDAGSEALRELPPGGRQAMDLGLELFEAFGRNAPAIERVAAEFPPVARRRFQVEALARWAETEPRAAFQQALAIEDRQLKTTAVRRVAASWAEHDLLGAQAAAELLNNDYVGSAFRSALVQRMGETDPAALVAYVNNSPQLANSIAQAVTEDFKAMDPKEALRWAEQMQGNVGESARLAAVQTWAQEDAGAAFAYVQSLRAGDERQQLMNVVATQYGRRAPESALAWVASLAAPPDLRASVISGIAQVDVDRAIDLAFRDPPQGGSLGGSRFDRWRFGMLNSVITNAMAEPNTSIPALASRVLALPDVSERSNALQMLMNLWLQKDPRATLDWITTDSGLPRDMLSIVIGNITRSDPLLAASYTNRVPAAARELWIADVAQSYARRDPQAATEWLGQFHDEREYSTGMAAIALQAIDYDPAMSARLLSSLRDSGENTKNAVQTVADSWAARDEQSARAWIRGLPEGPVRDSALRGFISRVYHDTVPESSVLALFSSEETKQQAVMGQIYAIGRKDLDEARRLVAQHISIPTIRKQADSWLESQDRRQDHIGVTIYPGGFITGN
jgi:hypothetical protein